MGNRRIVGAAIAVALGLSLVSTGVAFAAEDTPPAPASDSTIVAPPSPDLEATSADVELADPAGDPNEIVAETSSANAFVDDLLGVAPIAIGLLALVIAAIAAVKFAHSRGMPRAWVSVGLPVLALGGAAIFLFLQTGPEASTQTAGYGYSGKTSSYFLFQTRAVYGYTNSFVQELTTPAAIAEARYQMLQRFRSPKVPTGKLTRNVYGSQVNNPTWTWGWNADSMGFTRTTANQPCNRQQQALELAMAQKDVFAMTDFCPENTYVTQEIGATLPKKTHTVSVPTNAWLYAGVPGNNMHLDLTSGSALQRGKLKIIAYDTKTGLNREITNPDYAFHAGEGYYMLSISENYQGATGNRAVTFTGAQSYADTLHLVPGWNLVSFPNATKRTIASVYSIGTRYVWPADAVKQKLVHDVVSTYDYTTTDSYKPLSTKFANLNGQTMPGDHAFWVYAYRDVILQFK